MRKAIIISAVGHLIVILVAMFGIPHFMTREFVEPAIVPVDLVQEISEDASAPPPKAELDPKQQLETEPSPELKPETPEEAKPQPKPEPQTAAEEPQTPEDVVPEMKPEPEKKEEKPKPKTPEVTPQRRPDQPQKKFDPTKLSALLDKRIKEDTPDEKTEKKLDVSQILKRTSPVQSDSPSRTPMDKARIAANLQGLIRAQVEPCWTVPAGARLAENLQVRIRIWLQPNGALARAPEIVDSGRMNMAGQEGFRAAADSARRAVQRCAPLKLPPDTYDIWRDTELIFDPKDMLGG
ncbi:hypothetical protein [Govanella unica]|uniref:Cell envelope biogenesis protein TolA n=1 Tax=Govanella unica TaxID=2975056 RepID=A0A9X3Z8A5_9PROT|nr:hypothetical protein [Govania unica]MDA5194913.1 hypothetical protein [Govania unica]